MLRGRDNETDTICQNCFLVSVWNLSESCVPNYIPIRSVDPEISESVSQSVSFGFIPNIICTDPISDLSTGKIKR